MSSLCIVLAIAIAIISTAYAAPALVQNDDQKADAQRFDWSGIAPILVKGVTSYLANRPRIANGEIAENQEAVAQRFDWSEIAPILIKGVTSYLANRPRIANGEMAENQEADAQFWKSVARTLTPYLINKIAGGEIAMSEVAKAIPEEAKAEFWPVFLGSLASGLLARKG